MLWSPGSGRCLYPNAATPGRYKLKNNLMSNSQTAKWNGAESSRSERSGRLRSVGSRGGDILLVLVGCFLAQTLATSMRFPLTRISTVWFPGGLLVVALLLTPPRRWWLVLLAGIMGIAGRPDYHLR
jgi:hypothetical protein